MISALGTGRIKQLCALGEIGPILALQIVSKRLNAKPVDDRRDVAIRGTDLVLSAFVGSSACSGN
jgi:TRAP-type mannitol/chloroaromatic compound transport system permease large subunit